MITYHKLPTGEWVAYGPTAEVKLGPVEIHKRSGAVCHRVVDEVEILGEPFGSHSTARAIGYLTEHCKPESKAAHDKRKGITS